jgi:hypothetical protein
LIARPDPLSPRRCDPDCLFDPPPYDEEFENRRAEHRRIIDEAFPQLREIQEMLDEMNNLRGGGVRSDWDNLTGGAVKCK